MADVKARTAYFVKLERLEAQYNDADPTKLTEGQIKTFIKSADDYMKKIEDYHLRILNSCADQDAIDLQEDIIKPMEEKYQQLMGKLMDFKVTSGVSSRASPAVRLPDIQLPTFDGKYEDWPSFADLFNATVEKNSSLSPSQKLQYLKTCTKGDAATVIKSFTVTDSNYKPAWTLLKDRYSNSREIVNSLLRKLVHQPSMKVESAHQLQGLLNTTLECIRSLQVLGRQTDWDDLIVFITIDKLDGDTRAEWARSLKGSDPATFKDLQDFMEQHIRTIHARGTSKQASTSNSTRPRQINTHHSTQVPASSSCQVCKGNHQLYHCTKLREMHPDKRLATIKSTSACLNCLKDGHSVKNCNSTSRCRKCEKKHNTFLHLDSFKQDSRGSSSSSSAAAAVGNSTIVTKDGEARELRFNNNTVQSVSSVTLLKTAKVNVMDSTGITRSVKIVLDDGGEGSLINKSLIKRLGLLKHKTDVLVGGIGDMVACKSKWKVFIRLYSCINNSFADVELYSVPKVTGYINRITKGSPTTWNHIDGLELADPTFYDGTEVEILLGSDEVPYLIEQGFIKADKGSPAAQNTIFGWVLFGNVTKPVNQNRIIRTHHFTCDISTVLRKFWEMEEVPEQQAMTREEVECEQHFVKTHSRLQDGRYVARLPFNDKLEQLGSTRQQAEYRLHQLERRFRKYPHHKQQYIKFMQEYQDLNHMEKVSDNSTAVKAIYLPHHFVLKEDSTTTKLRTVFDGSAKSSTGVALNDALMVGATIQPDLFTLLLRFRFFKIALKADICKMYRQFRIHPADCDYQRILWREDSMQPIQEYRLLTVTYGTASAPFLATRCLNQLAEDEKDKYPAAAAAILTCMYIDDYIGGAHSKEEALQLVHEMRSIISSAGMDIRKWCSNQPAILAALPPEMREEGADFDFDDNQHGNVKALGIRWNPATDTFCFKVIITSSDNITKRHLLSEIAKTFDPLGWLAPVTVNAKILLQKLWLQGYDWDKEVTSDIKEHWDNYQQDLKEVEQLKIPRCVIRSEVIHYELHGYCDSSELAYSCAVYLKCKFVDGSVSVNLLTARTKVAPLKVVSLPKLELSGAKLLAETIAAVQKGINFNHHLFCWTDSTITLRWISAHSRRWKTYVANRVADIQSLIPPEHWHHVRSEDNPADLPSRGISASQLVSSELWWNGPNWLQNDNYPVSSQKCNDEEVKKEEKTKQLTCFHLSLNATHNSLFDTFSSFRKLCRAAAILIRFVEFKTNKSTIPKPLSADDLHVAKLRLARWSQHASFASDMVKLKKDGQVSTSSKLTLLYPFIDSEGVLRVGGRLINSKLPAQSKNPIILSGHHQLSKLIIAQVHQDNLHSGFTLTLSTIQQQYWMTGARDAVRHYIRKCVVCRRNAARTAEQLMGNLPTGRVTQPERPFMHCGVDFAGPFPVKLRKGRHVPAEKAYFAIFVCLATKAVHLESVNKLTTDDFIACYERFTARRGKPAHLYSDNGTNFVGADRILRQYLADEEARIQKHFANSGTQWHFNPPSAPHQGGLWEAGVKSVKFHFRRVVGTTTLMLDQFQTLLCKIEACLNSRPLCALSSDPLDIDPLTPGHFLIGGPITSIPEPDCTLLKENRLSYWELVRQMTQRFWNRWSNEYLTQLQQRFKWTQKRNNLQAGDLVVIKDELLPVAKWKLGKVLRTMPGSDGLVRSVILKTATGEVERPIAKLSPLITNFE